MKDKNLINSEDRALENMLKSAAGQVEINPSFKNELEKKIMNAHKPKAGLGFFSVKKVVSTIGWTIGLAAMTLMFIWVIRAIAPQPQPATNDSAFPQIETATPEASVSESAIPESETYVWGGTTLYLNAPLPATPAEANVYIAQPDQPATIESARALAKRFGIEGQVYTAPGELPNTKNFLVTAGGPRIYVRSDNYFLYYKNYSATMINSKNITDDQAAAAIADFLKSHGFEFEYQISHAPQIPSDYYIIQNLDGYSLHHDYLMPVRLEIEPDDNGDVIKVYGALLGTKPVGAFGIRSAEEAFQQILQNASIGVEQSTRSTGILDVQNWQREYRDNEVVPIYGEVRVFPSAEAGQPSFITVNDYPVTGNTSGLESIDEGVLVEASGQFITENGIRTFIVDTWQNPGLEMFYATGSLHKDGDQVILAADDGKEYPLVGDVPADVPLNTLPQQLLTINGVAVNGQLDWMLIQYFPNGGSGGGGGGGNMGFYKLNLTGTPMPLPTPEPTQAPPKLEDMPKLEGTQGMLSVTLRQGNDNSLTPEYILLVDSTLGFNTNYIQLTGDSLEALQSYNHRPVTIWATPDHFDTSGVVVMKVSRYEIPYPNLETQILKGSEVLREVNGQTIALFTTEQGVTYAELYEDGTPSEYLMTDSSKIQLEALLIPDETYGGYPALRIISGGMPVVDSITGAAIEYIPTSNEPNILPEIPTMTIEKVELVYYIKDPRYELVPADPAYVQPMWRFYGHYSNGDEFEFLVQALKDEFLSPEIQSVEPPG